MARKIVNWLPVAHHHSQQLDRCVLLPLGQRRLAVCARCLGLYPVLLVVLTGQILLNLQPAGPLDWWLVIIGTVPALTDWAVSRLDRWRGNNAIRLATGAIVGAALGRSLFLYFRDQRSEVFLVHLMLIGFSVGAVEIVRVLRIR